MGKRSWWGHGRDRSFSWVWLNHRRSSSGLSDKTWQLLWKSGQQPWGRSLAFQLFAEQTSIGSCRLIWSWGDWRGQWWAAVPPVSGSLANSVTGWLRPSPSSQREEQEERLGANAQLSKCTHRARVGRVSTGLGSTVLSDAC